MNLGVPRSACSALSLLIIEKLLHQGVQMNSKNGVGGQSYWIMSTFSSNAQKYLLMGENKNSSGEEILSLDCASLAEKATRPGKTTLKINTQRALHALVPFFQPLGN